MAVILAIGAILFVSCGKEEIENQNNIDSKRQPTNAEIIKLSQILGVKPEMIASVQVLEGYYYEYTVTETYGFLGMQTRTKRLVGCTPPPDVLCLFKVHIKVGMKSADSEPEGYNIFMRQDETGKIESLIFVCGKVELIESGMITNGKFIFTHNTPIIDAQEIGLCDNEACLFIKQGMYDVNYYGDLAYYIVPISDCEIHDNEYIELL